MEAITPQSGGNFLNDNFWEVWSNLEGLCWRPGFSFNWAACWTSTKELTSLDPNLCIFKLGVFRCPFICFISRMYFLKKLHHMPICIPPPYNVFVKQPHEMLCSSIWCHDKCLKLGNLQRKDISYGFELGNLRPRCLDVVPGDGLSCAHARSQKEQRETASIKPFCNSSVHSLGQNPGVLNTSPSAPLPTVLQ